MEQELWKHESSGWRVKHLTEKWIIRLSKMNHLVEENKWGSNGAPMWLQWGEMGENDLSDLLDFSCIFNNSLLFFWGG